MKTLPANTNDQQILDAIREWAGLLVQARYEDACKFLYHPENQHPWTPELIARQIHNYGDIEPREQIFKVTPLEEARADPPRYPEPRHDVHRYDEPAQDSEWSLERGKVVEIGASSATRKRTHIGYVCFDLPLNGYWSDLTATFDLRLLEDKLVLELEDIHIM